MVDPEEVCFLAIIRYDSIPNCKFFVHLFAGACITRTDPRLMVFSSKRFIDLVDAHNSDILCLRRLDAQKESSAVLPSSTSTSSLGMNEESC